ncbi:MAG TPA: lysozyme inhibitor LprI family protein [Acetobacteraceae bacterium]|jgi:uncharacterized protein YecT (DUF1311 family)
MFVKFFACIAIIALALCAPALAQQGADCSRAKTDAEKAICGHPALAAADAAMARAYTKLRLALPAAQRAPLLADQRDWIEIRAGNCDAPPTGDLAACLMSETRRRREFLLSQLPGSGAPRMQLYHFHTVHDGNTSDAAFPQIIAPRDSAQRAFNKMARDVALGEGTPFEYSGEKPPDTRAGDDKSYDASYEITWLDRRLAAVEYTIYTYDGGAHPNWSRRSLLFDLLHGEPLFNGDMVGGPPHHSAEGFATIASMCARQLLARKDLAFYAVQMGKPLDVSDVVSDPTRWVVDGDGVDIMFDPDTIAAPAVGEVACRLQYAELRPWLRPHGPLPPHGAGG